MGAAIGEKIQESATQIGRGVLKHAARPYLHIIVKGTLGVAIFFENIGHCNEGSGEMRVIVSCRNAYSR